MTRQNGKRPGADLFPIVHYGCTLYEYRDWSLLVWVRTPLRMKPKVGHNVLEPLAFMRVGLGKDVRVHQQVVAQMMALDLDLFVIERGLQRIGQDDLGALCLRALAGDIRPR